MEAPTRPRIVAKPQDLEWGFTRAFRVARKVVRQDHPDPGKWIAFLPATMPAACRQELFDALATQVLALPRAGCDLGKVALEPLWTHPDRVALMFYCDASRRADLLAALRPLARRYRKAWVARGALRPGDGFLGGWKFKTDAQTLAEMQAGTHPAQVSRQMEWLGVEPPVGKPRRLR